MTNTIVAQSTIETVDALRDTLDAAFATHSAAFAASIAAPRSIAAVRAVRAAFAAQEQALAAWKAGEAALQAMWRAQDEQESEQARMEAMCAAYDDLELDSFDDHAYQLTSQGTTYLDRHYATHSAAGMLSSGGDSPYGDGTTGYIQPTPAHPCYRNGVCDMDALSRYEDLSY